MSDLNQETLVLLHRWHEGDQGALDALIQRDLPWILSHVRRRLGPRLRAKMETLDAAQDAFVDILRNGPKFLLANHAHFRAMMARIIENSIRDQHEHFSAKKRRPDQGREVGESVLLLDDAARTMTTPSQHAGRNEREGWVHLALEFLDAEDRKLIRLRQWEERSHAAVAEELGISEDAARMRFNRALGRLARKLKELQAGSLLGSTDEPVE